MSEQAFIRPEAIASARARIADLNRSFIGDDFVAAGAADVLPTLDPYSGEPMVAVEMADAELVGRAVRAGRDALAGPWGRTAQGDRATLLRALADRVMAEREELAILEALDVGKPITNCLTEDVPMTAETLRWYASLLDTYYDLSARRPSAVAQVVREPRGVVGIVLPWNYPLYTLALKLAPALASGNTVVAKPAEDTPLTTLRLAQLAIEVGFPAGVFNVVPGRGSVAGQAIGRHPDIDAINFTGSTEVGRMFLRYSADSNLKEVSLECGGKNPALVLPDVADLQPHMEAIATGFMINSGQVCSSISRLLLPSALREQAHAALDAAMRSWPIGDPMNVETRLGPLINDAQAAKVRDAVEAERARNNEILVSGATSTGSSDRLVRPTVFFDVDEKSDTWREEIFGPVLSVRYYDEVDAAIRSANDTSYGLSAYLFSNDAVLTSDVAARLDAGFVSINSFGEGDFSTPFGGFKLSGFGGKDKGIHSLDQYSRTKSIWWDMSAHPAGR